MKKHRSWWGLFVFLAIVASCSNSPLSRFEGRWSLDIDHTMNEIRRLNLDIADPALNDLRYKLEDERPELIIHRDVIRMRVQSAVTQIEYKVLTSNGKCVDLLIAEKTSMRYCSEGPEGNTLTVAQTQMKAGAISDVYKRISG